MHIQHKWCVHLILPLAPRAKQPTFHTGYKQYTIQWTVHMIDCHSTLQDTVQEAVKLNRFQLAAGGGEQNGFDILQLLF
jgi:hypothetical protein